MNKASAVAEHSQTVGAIYEAGLNPDLWPQALEYMCEELNADKATMLYINPKDWMFSFTSGYGFDPHENGIGAARFRSHLAGDPVAIYGLSHLDEVFSDRRVIDPAELHASSMHQEIRKPADMEFLLTSFLTDGDLDWTGICFFRPESAQPFDDENERHFTLLAQHIRRASRIHKLVSCSERMSSLHNSLLDGLDCGVVIVDEQLRVVVSNEHARQVCLKDYGVNLEGDQLDVRDRTSKARLQECVSSVLASKSETLRPRNVLRIKSGGRDNDSVMAVVTGLRPEKFVEKQKNLKLRSTHYTARIPSRHYVMITFYEISTQRECDKQFLKDLFGLTPAEAELAASLSQGMQLKEAAFKLGRSVSTARVQLNSIFRKTETHRQSSLVQLMMTLPVAS